MTLHYLKPLHISLSITWVSGILVLLLWSQTQNSCHQLQRWNKLAALPAMTGSLISGIYLLMSGGWLSSDQIWIIPKLTLITLLIATHGYQSGKLSRTLAVEETAEEVKFSSAFSSTFLWITVMSTIIFLASLKPF